jgi:hypothetical protein
MQVLTLCSRSARSTAVKHIPSGTTIHYVLSAPGTVSIAIKDTVPGVSLKGKGCVALTAASRKTFLASAARTLKGTPAGQLKKKEASLLARARFKVVAAPSKKR